MKYSCGCINETDSDSGVLHCIKKCEFHLKWAAEHQQGGSIEYFKDVGCINAEGIPTNANLVGELWDGISLNDRHYLSKGLNKNILEIGAGLGPYVPYFLRCQWYLTIIERGDFASRWLKNTFYIPVLTVSIEEYLTTSDINYHCIFAAHLFEHLENMPKVLRQCFDRVTERLYFIVPDDGDPTNPDHYWFFTQETLKALLEKIGFVKVRMQMRKRVPQENFIYCVAEKP